MNSSYIRTAIIKGLPYHSVVMRHAVRNALIAPITVIMLHVNWLVGGIVIVEVVFGYQAWVPISMTPPSLAISTQLRRPPWSQWPLPWSPHYWRCGLCHA
ncbi:MAG: ABC transporter permease subunit [Caldilineaceae bacterium]